MKPFYQQSSPQYPEPVLRAVQALGVEPIGPPFSSLFDPPGPGRDQSARHAAVPHRKPFGDFCGPAEPSLWTERLRLDDELGRRRLERALTRRFGPRLVPSATDLEEVVKLEGIYAQWQRAQTVSYAGLILHRAVNDVDPLAAEIWQPRRLGPRHGSRARFSQVLRVLWRSREQGRLHELIPGAAMALYARELGCEDTVTTLAPSHGARRCEGRSRAPQGSAGGARVGSGGSRRGGGDRGDDGGGGGSDGSGGGSAGSGGSRRRIDWPAVGGVTGVLALLLTAAIFVFGSLHSDPTPVTVTPQVIVKQVTVPSRPPKVIVVAPAGHHRAHLAATTTEGEVKPTP